MNGERIDDALRRLGELPEPPPPGPLLEAELAGLRPVATRRPGLQLAVLLGASAAVAGILLVLVTLRRDLPYLPRAWLVLYCAGWTAAFLGLGALALLPRRGQVAPAWRVAGVAALAAGAGFVTAGLLLARNVPGVSADGIGGSVYDVCWFGKTCMSAGVAVAVVPIVLGTLFLRGSVPVGGAWAGAALGACGGALGGLVLHLHCPITHPTHLGLVHGGAVVVSALLGALAGWRLLRP
ncbi:MAG TPA: NrsF family protein [Kofleriaceae bacterium]|nr:NrsF family protein [Kofleriaceae bacterium]